MILKSYAKADSANCVNFGVKRGKIRVDSHRFTQDFGNFWRESYESYRRFTQDLHESYESHRRFKRFWRESKRQIKANFFKGDK